MLDAFKAKLNARFGCSGGGPVSYFLSFNVFRNRPERKLFVSQEHYIEAVLERFNMAECTPVKTPLPTGFKSVPATDEEFADVRHEEYPAMVGSIMYAATITRPDIARAAGVLARTASKWNKTQVHAAAICSGTSVAQLSSASPLTPPLPSVSSLGMLMPTGDVSTLGAPPQATFFTPLGALLVEVSTTSYNSYVNCRSRRHGSS
jgi:hypothetical protein